MANEKTTVKGLSITAKRESYYAGGITTPFTFEARVIPLSELSKQQIQDLKEDPYILTKEVDFEPEKKA